MAFICDPCVRDYVDYEVCSHCLMRDKCDNPKTKFYDIERKC